MVIGDSAGDDGLTDFATANTYTGGTTIVSGMLDLEAFGAAGAGAITLQHTGGVITALAIDRVATNNGVFANPVDGLAGGGFVDLAGLIFRQGLSAYTITGGTLTVTGLTESGAAGHETLQTDLANGQTLYLESDGGTGTILSVNPFPTITLATVGDNDVVNRSTAEAGLTLSGQTGDGAVGIVEIAVLNTSGRVVGQFSSSIANNAYSVHVSPSAAQSLPDGVYTVAATVLNADGNPAAPAVQQVTLHETLPTVTLAEVNGTDTVNASQAAASVTLSGTTTGIANGAMVDIVVTNSSNVTIASFSADDTGSGYSHTVGPGALHSLPDGAYTVTATATDAFGNTNSAVQSITVHQTLPTIQIAAVNGNNTVTAAQASQSVTISGATTGIADGTSVQVDVQKAGSTHVTMLTASDTGNAYSVTLTPAQSHAFASGSYNITADVTDAYGNVAQEATDTVTVQAGASGGAIAASSELISLGVLLATPILGAASSPSLVAPDLIAVHSGTTAEATSDTSGTLTSHLAASSEHAAMTHDHVFGHVF